MTQPHQAVSVTRGRARFWLALFLIGVMIYLVTKRPLLGTVLPFLAAGWPFLRSGWWLLHADPEVTRGRVCFLFYLAAGCWWAAASAVASVLAFITVGVITGNQPDMAEFEATMLVLTAGVVLNTLFGLVATAAALTKGIRVWVGSRVRDVWLAHYPPRTRMDHWHMGFNHAVFVVGTSLVVPVLILGAVLLVPIPNIGDKPDLGDKCYTILAFTVMFIGPLSMIPVYAFLSHRVIAQSPADCWGVKGDGSLSS